MYQQNRKQEIMEFKDTQEILFMRKTLEETMRVRYEIQQKESMQKKKLAEAVQANVRSPFKDFKDGEKVKVTFMIPRGPWDVEVTKYLFFHQPTCMGHLNGTAACDYEIRFHGMKKDGTESKRDDFYENHVPMGRLISIEKI